MVRDKKKRSENRLAILRYLSKRWVSGPKNAFDGPAEHSQPEIARYLGVVRSNISGILDELQMEGLIVFHSLRTVGNARRRKIYFITSEGLDILQEVDGRRP
jgi:DNA-binding MarR family transcriptional regulator